MTGIEQQKPGGHFEKVRLNDPMQLPWAHIGLSQIDVHHRIRRYFDVVKTTDFDNKLDFVSYWPLTLRGVFANPGVFRFTLSVVGEGITTTTQLELDWPGKWDQIKVRELVNADK